MRAWGEVCVGGRYVCVCVREVCVRDVPVSFQARLQKAIESCKEPLHIAQQCLANR